MLIQGRFVYAQTSTRVHTNLHIHRRTKFFIELSPRDGRLSLLRSSAGFVDLLC